MDLGQQSVHHRGYRNETDVGLMVARSSQNTLLVPGDRPDNLNNVDLNCLMTDVMFHHHQQSVPPPAQHNPNTHSFQPQIIGAGPPTLPANFNGSDIHITVPSRKRRASQHLNANQECVGGLSTPQAIPHNIKRSPSSTPISIIKPEPGNLCYQLVSFNE